MGRTEGCSLANPLIRRDFTRKLREDAVEKSLVDTTSHGTFAGGNLYDSGICKPLFKAPGSLGAS